MSGKLPPFSVTEEDGSPIVYQPWKIKFSNGVVTDNGDGTVSVNISAGTAGAPTTASYITQTPDATLSAEQALSLLATGILKSTSNTGVITIASGGVDFQTVFLASSPLLFNGTTLGIQPSATNQDGYLSQSNFNLFNAKVGTTRAITIVAPLSGGGDLSADRVIAILSSTATSDGYLKSSDFNTFNAKASTATTISTVSPLSGGGSLAANRTISLTTDGTTTNFLRGDGVYATPPTGGGGGLAWGIISTTSITVGMNSGYIGNTTALITYTLPAIFSIGSSFKIVEFKGGSWKIVQLAGQQLFFGHTSTTLGATGYLQSSDTGDAIEMVCCQINSNWATLNAVGNINFN